MIYINNFRYINNLRPISSFNINRVSSLSLSEYKKNDLDIVYNPIIGSNLGIPLNILQYI